jgi:hypothetical protein
MEHVEFSIPVALRFGWETFKKHANLLIGLYLFIGVLWFAVSAVQEALTEEAPAVGLLMGLIWFGVDFLLNIGVMRIGLKLHDGLPAAFSDLFGGVRYLFTFIIATVLFGVMVFVGLLLLIVPGIMLALALGFFGWLIVDQHTGIFESFSQSAHLTRGHRCKLFGYYIVAG